MPAVGQIEKINENTTLIDIGLFGVEGVAGVYLLEGDRKCLIDSGSRKEAKKLINILQSLDAFPPDLIIATHAHYDHAQGIPQLCREAQKRGKKIEIMASEEAVPLLADASYNKDFNEGPYESITGVVPLREGDIVDLGGLALKTYYVPGHCMDHIAFLDQKNKDLFVGDAVGYWIDNQTYIPPFMPPSWDPEAFSSTIDKVNELDYERLCLAHFGTIPAVKANDFLDQAEQSYEAWWQLFEENEDKLDDPAGLLEALKSKLNPPFPELTIMSPKLKILFSLMVAGKKITGKKVQPLSELLLMGLLENLTCGYRTYKQSST